MNNDIFEFLQLERQIFGVCPKCYSFFRLSECKIFLKEKRPLDWLTELEKSSERLEKAEARLEVKEREIRDKAREKGRKQALTVVKRIDKIFTPRGLNPDDAKLLFHPLDYVVFKGMKTSGKIENIILFDRERRDATARKLQRSIERTVASGNYEWQTIRIDEVGKITRK